MVFLSVYLVSVGHGFISDDYRWLLESRVSSLDDLGHVLLASNGFYRPLVSLTFALDRWVFGLQPLGYGLTNLCLALVDAWLVRRLAGTMRLNRGAAVLAGSLWLLNFHGINMAVLWVSGRTALLLVGASAGAAIALLRGRTWLALLCLAAALVSKEEAIALPFVLIVWVLLLDDSPATGRNRML